MRVICDIETDSLNPTVIWCIVCKDIDDGRVYTFPPDRLRDFSVFVNDVRVFVGHNFLGFDLWAINKLIPGVNIDPRKCIDTLVCSRLFNYSLPDGHSLDAWGTRLGTAKGNFKDFSHYSQEMLDYCIQDVEVTYKLFKKFEPYINDDQWKSSLRTEHDVAVLCRELHENGFTFNLENAKVLYGDVSERVGALRSKIAEAFAPRAKPIRVILPKETKHGTLSRTDFRWVEDGDLTPYSTGCEFTRIRWEEFNPGSPKQIVDRFNEFGWNPVEKTDGHVDCIRDLSALRRKRNRERFKLSSRKLAALDTDIQNLEAKLVDFQQYGWKVSETNLDTLPEDAPEEARLLVEWRFIEKRRQTLEEWMGAYNPNTHRIHGNFNGLGAWTHRFSHSNPNMANVPSTSSKYNSARLKELAADAGKQMRGLWTVPSGRRLVGVDAEGIQLRIFAHYINDYEFTEALVSGDKSKGTDAHTLNAVKLGIGPKRRENAKTFIYAFLLGAGIDKVSKILDTNYTGAQQAVNTFLEGYPGLQFLKEEVIPKDADRGFFEGFDGRLVACTSEHLMLAGYLQNGESVIMKRANLLWSQKLRKDGVDFKQVNFVHDEWQTEVPDDDAIAEHVANTQIQAIVQTGVELGLNCPLAGSKNIGYSWYDTH